jgi:hypothetical protein
MSTKQKTGTTPAPAQQPEPVNWEAKAKKLYDDLGKGEQSAAETYWRLGEALRHCQKEHFIKGWDDLLTFANDKLGMDNKSKVTRSLRIFDQHKDDIKQVTGKSIADACGYRCKDEPEPNKPDRTPQEVDAEWQTWEFVAAKRVVKALGGERAKQVVGWVVEGKEPPKSPKKAKKVKVQVPEEVEQVSPLVKPDQRKAFWQNPQGWVAEVNAERQTLNDEFDQEVVALKAVKQEAKDKGASATLQRMATEAAQVALKGIESRRLSSLHDLALKRISRKHVHGNPHYNEDYAKEMGAIFTALNLAVGLE